MALEYRLTLAGGTSAEELAGRAFPDAAERPGGSGPLLTADLMDRSGFTVSVRAGHNGYVDVETDQGQWTWEPDAYVSMTLRMDKFAEPGWNVINMLSVVQRVLQSGPEDVVLVLNGDVLLLTRFGGILTKQRRDTWWAHYAGADDAVPG